jgi:hypothetical protein
LHLDLRTRLEPGGIPFAAANSGQRKEDIVTMMEGETYRCIDSSCGCEVKVTRGSSPGKGEVIKE